MEIESAIRQTLLNSSRALGAAADGDLSPVARAADIIATRLIAGATLFAFGNGGSAADAEHLAAELVGRYGKDRRPLAAHALTTSASSLTAIANDYGFDEVFARQVRGVVRAGDVCVGISTSGESANVIRGIEAAREKGAVTIALTGRGGGRLAQISDIAIVVAEQTAGRIQEVHRAIIHAMCEVVEARL